MTMSNEDFQQNMMQSFIQIAAVVIIVAWCFTIVSPFISIVLWSMIISVALYPLQETLAKKFGDRPKLSAALLTLIGLTILVVPMYMLTGSTISGLSFLAHGFENGTLHVPKPGAAVAEWPLVGPTIFELWTSASDNVAAFVSKYSDQFKGAGQWFLGLAKSAVGTTLVFVVSILVAGVFLVSANGSYKFATRLGATISPEHGQDMVDMSIATIRSVAKGVLGVAFIQSLLSAIGLVVMDVPAAGLWAGIILMLAIVQLPPLIILAPISVWVFSVADPVPATLFAVYAFIVSISDSFLKPMFLGRGMDIPMLVILIGAIGGAMTSGIIGLFIGAVVLAVGYKLVTTWIISDDDSPSTSEESPAS